MPKQRMVCVVCKSAFIDFPGNRSKFCSWSCRKKGIKQEGNSHFRHDVSNNEIRRLYLEEKQSIYTIGDAFDMRPTVVSRRLHAMGISRRGPRQMYICLDGHRVKSLAEQKVDNWLFEHNLVHVYEPRVFDKYSADFLVKSVYIEIWGVEHSPKYEKRKSIKQTLYKQNRIKLIEFESGHLSEDTLNNKLNVLVDHK